MTTRAELIAEAVTWEGVRYKHLGRSRFGVDCAGLVIKTAHGVGLTTYDTVNYPQRPNSHHFMREMKDHLTRGLKSQARPGDVMLFRGDRVPCHVGILLPEDRIIHAYLPAKRVVIESYPGQLGRLAVCSFSFAGLED